jgi:hypothetical protein
VLNAQRDNRDAEYHPAYLRKSMQEMLHAAGELSKGGGVWLRA